jgi:hypothetical protein
MASSVRPPRDRRAIARRGSRPTPVGAVACAARDRIQHWERVFRLARARSRMEQKRASLIATARPLLSSRSQWRLVPIGKPHLQQSAAYYLTCAYVSSIYVLRTVSLCDNVHPISSFRRLRTYEGSACRKLRGERESRKSPHVVAAWQWTANHESYQRANCRQHVGSFRHWQWSLRHCTETRRSATLLGNAACTDRSRDC